MKNPVALLDVVALTAGLPERRLVAGLVETVVDLWLPDSLASRAPAPSSAQAMATGGNSTPPSSVATPPASAASPAT